MIKNIRCYLQAAKKKVDNIPFGRKKLQLSKFGYHAYIDSAIQSSGTWFLMFKNYKYQFV